MVEKEFIYSVKCHIVCKALKMGQNAQKEEFWVVKLI